MSEFGFETETLSSEELLKLKREAAAREAARIEAKRTEGEPTPEIIEPAKMREQDASIEELFEKEQEEPTAPPRVPTEEPEILRLQRIEQERLTAERLRKKQEEAQRVADIKFAEEAAAREEVKPAPTVVSVQRETLPESLKGTISGTIFGISEEGFRIAESRRKKGDILAAIITGSAAVVVEAGAGVVTAAESLLELVGGKDVPDIGSGLVGSVAKSFEGTKIDLSKPSGLGIEVEFTAKKTEELEFFEKRPAALAGAIIGELITGAVLGKALVKVVKPLVKPVKRIIGKAKITPAEEAALQGGKVGKGVDDITGFKPPKGVKPLTRQQKIQIGKEKPPKLTKEEVFDIENIFGERVGFKKPLSRQTKIQTGIEEFPKLSKKETKAIQETLGIQPEKVKPLTRQQRIQLGKEEVPRLTRKEAETLADIFKRKPKGAKQLTRQERIQIGREKVPSLTRKEAEALADIFGKKISKVKPLTRQQRIQIGKEDFPALTRREARSLDDILGGKGRPKLEEGLIPKEELPKVTLTQAQRKAKIVAKRPKVGAPLEFEKRLGGLPRADEARGIVRITFGKPPKGVKVKVGRQVAITKQVTKVKVKKVLRQPKTLQEAIQGVAATQAAKAALKKPKTIMDVVTEKTPIASVITVPKTKKKVKPDVVVDVVAEPITDPVQEPIQVPDVIVETKPKRKPKQPAPILEFPDFGPGGKQKVKTKPKPPALILELPVFGPGGKPKLKEPITKTGPIPIIDLPTKPKTKPITTPKFGPIFEQPTITKPKVTPITTPKFGPIFKIPTPTKPVVAQKEKPLFGPIQITDIIQVKRGRRVPPFLKREKPKKRRLREKERFGRKRFVNPLAEVEDVLGVRSRRTRKRDKGKSLGNLNFF